MFYQLATDGTQRRCDLQHLFAGPDRTRCWIIAGGPSLSTLATDQITSSPVPKFAMNLAGHGILRPNFWTSYDPTARFQRSIYLDASIMKFVHRGRAMDLIPETAYKVCEAPATFVLDRNRDSGFTDFPSATGVTDWQDSLIQAISIAYQLGFRELLLAGTDMYVAPSEALQQRGMELDVPYEPRELLKDYVQRLSAAGVPRTEIEALSTARQYHFEEQKDFNAAINTDFHYFRVAQYLRLARKSMLQKGLTLISVTPESRLNDYFPYEALHDVLHRIEQEVGHPANESTRGLYSHPQERKPAYLGPMRDFKPHFWPEKGKPLAQANRQQPGPPNPPPTRCSRCRNIPPVEVEVDLNEVG